MDVIDGTASLERSETHWDLKRVEDLTLSISSGTSKHSADGDYPVFGSTGIIGMTNSPNYSGWAILIARVGANAGKIGIANGRYGVTDNTLIVRVAPDVHGPYLKEQLESRRLNTLIFGSGQPLITGSLLKDIVLPVPPTRREQEDIAEALSDIDASIGSLEQLLAKKRDVMQGASHELICGKRRLPGFERPWVQKRLGDTALVKARIGWQGLTTAEYLDSGDYRLVTGTDFKSGRIDWGSCLYVDYHRYVQDKYIQLSIGDVLVTKDGTIGKVAVVEDLSMPATLNSGIFVIRPLDASFHPGFLFFVLRSRIFEDFLSQLSAGSTINHLYQKDFVDFVYSAPPSLEEQRSIASTLLGMGIELRSLESKIEKTRSIKQGMMQELLTGKVRLV